MARTTSDEEIQLRKRARRRLVGAVVLAVAVAVLLPMVLDTEPKPVSNNVNIQIPSPDSPAYAPKGAEPAPVDPAQDSVARPLKPDTAPAAGSQASEAPKAPEAPQTVEAPRAVQAPRAAEAPKAAAPEKEDVRPAPKEAAKAPAGETAGSAPKEAAKPAEKSAAKPSSGKFVVQLAALSDAAKAKQLQQRVARAGVKAYTEVVKTAKGDVTRVRAGPFDTREAAEKARARLKGAGLDGKVVPR